MVAIASSPAGQQSATDSFKQNKYIC